MKERGILFSASMVRAIIEGRKTQTRRIVNPQPPLCIGFPHLANDHWGIYLDRPNAGPYKHLGRCLYGIPGDRLWVRETWRRDLYYTGSDKQKGIEYRADRYDDNRTWKPAIHMPRYASRITLELVGVRVERLQDITPEDIRAEGYPKHVVWHTFVKCYRDEEERNHELIKLWIDGWDELNKKRGYGWDVNPWVWKLEFKKL